MQFNVAVLIYCAALFQGAICAIRRDCECGIGNEEEIDTRIINGIVTYPHQYPWMVYLKYMGRVFCGGAILNDRYVITAGHCLYDMQPQYMQIVVGGHDSEVEDGITVDVEALKLHENYTRYAAYDDNDIGIIKLSKTLHLNNNINPICLPNPGNHKNRAKVVIAGWGITEKKQMSRYLLHNSVRILSQSDCKNANRIGSKFRVLENLCAYGHATDTICRGSSVTAEMAIIASPSATKYCLTINTVENALRNKEVLNHIIFSNFAIKLKKKHTSNDNIEVMKKK